VLEFTAGNWSHQYKSKCSLLSSFCLITLLVIADNQAQPYAKD
jgi:hypothetical protein